MSHLGHRSISVLLKHIVCLMRYSNAGAGYTSYPPYSLFFEYHSTVLSVPLDKTETSVTVGDMTYTVCKESS